MKNVLRAVAPALLVGLVVFAIVTLAMSPDAVAGKGGGKGGPPNPCGDCPCAPTIGECYLESCHLLFPSECLWDCHYVCPFPG